MNSFGVQLSHLLVARPDGTDPRAEAIRVLAEHRVLAGLKDATSVWVRSESAMVIVPRTDDERVLTLDEDDRIETTLSLAALSSAFSVAGLTLAMYGDEPMADVDESDGSGLEYGDATQSAVRVASFSRRALLSARVLAQVNRVTVEHVESAGWSLQLFQTTEPTRGWATSRAEGPSIDVNRPGADAGVWIDVDLGGRRGTAMFWPDAERDTVPVLDIASITQSESVDVYRRLLTEGDGSRDELEEIAHLYPLDVDAAHASLAAEALGGIVGADERLRAFLGAFGVADTLIDFSLDADEASADLERHVVTPDGWLAVMGESAVDGYSAAVPLSRRGTALSRAAGWLRENPLRSGALALGELAIGAALFSRGGRVRRVFGAVVMADAAIDAMIAAVRARRSR